MLTGNLPQQDTIRQYTADGVTTAYVYPFKILIPQDIAVYVTLSGQNANQIVDLKVLNTAYTVQNAGNLTGGTITFLNGYIPPLGAIVTLVRNMEVSIDTEFAQAQNFNGQNLDNAFERVVLIMQQLNTDFQLRCLSYIINSYLPTLGSNFLPVLTNEDNQVWVSQGGEIIAASIETNPDISLLRSELASQTEGGDGAGLIGYYDENNSLGQTLKTFLNNLPAYITTIVNNIVSNTNIVFPVGFIAFTYDPISPVGWLILVDNHTIGSPLSGANFANNSAYNLFIKLWNNTINADCPVLPSKGVSADVDWLANCTLQLPSTNGRPLVNLQGFYRNAEIFGAPEVSLVAANNGPHSHSISQNWDPGSPGTANSIASDQGVTTGTQLTNINIGSQGNGIPFSIIPPEAACNFIIKL